MRKENSRHEAHHSPDRRGVAAWIGALMANSGHLSDPAYRAYGAIVIDGDDADLEEFLPKESATDNVTELADERSETLDRTQGLPAGSFKELHDKLKQVASNKASTEKFLDAFMSGWGTPDGEPSLKAS